MQTALMFLVFLFGALTVPVVSHLPGNRNVAGAPAISAPGRVFVAIARKSRITTLTKVVEAEVLVILFQALYLRCSC
jgi:hypothetical protein